LQCAAVCCSVLKCAAVCCSVLQYAAVCCSALHLYIYIGSDNSAKLIAVVLFRGSLALVCVCECVCDGADYSLGAYFALPCGHKGSGVVSRQSRTRVCAQVCMWCVCLQNTLTILSITHDQVHVTSSVYLSVHFQDGYIHLSICLLLWHIRQCICVYIDLPYYNPWLITYTSFYLSFYLFDTCIHLSFIYLSLQHVYIQLCICLFFWHKRPCVCASIDFPYYTPWRITYTSCCLSFYLSYNPWLIYTYFLLSIFLSTSPIIPHDELHIHLVVYVSIYHIIRD